MKLVKYSGYYLIATGIIHNLLGLALGWSSLVEMHQAGWFSATIIEGEMHFDREAISWFLISGSFWVLFGLFLQKMLDKGIEPPSSLGWGLLLIGGVIAFIMPVSGAYLLVLQGAVLIYGRQQMRMSQL